MTPKTRIDDIEVLRGVAILLALIEHMHVNLITWKDPFFSTFFTYWGGWAGVDLFFAISGYVIAKDLVPKLQQTDNRLQYLNITIAFWIRRFWRIIPSAWTWLLLILLATLFLNQSGAWGTFQANFETVIAALFQVANLHVVVGYEHGFMGAAFPYWSLSLEEQFYLLLPFIVMLSGRYLPYVLGALILFQFLQVRDTLYWSMIRSDALFLGVLLALWSKTPSYKLFDPVIFQSNWFLRFLIIGVLLLGIATAGSQWLNVIDHHYSLIAVIAVLLVLIASYDKDYIAGVIPFLKKPFIWIGTRSYALYLIHMPAYLLTREIWYRIEPPGTVFDSSYTLKFLLTAAAILVICADLNYRFLETPLRERGIGIASRVRKRSLTNPEQQDAADATQSPSDNARSKAP